MTFSLGLDAASSWCQKHAAFEKNALPFAAVPMIAL